MKALEFIYQDTEIHFSLNPTDENVMVNATEMAKHFGKRTEDFMKTKNTKDFIKVLEKKIIHPLNRGQIIDNRGRNGIYFHRILALKFAAWLDVEFEVWVFETIEKIKFGHYKEHWDAHVWQEEQIMTQANLASQLLSNPTTELFKDYLKAGENIKKAAKIKRKSIANQYKLFENGYSG